MSMQANKRESHWISVPITQGGTESDWIEQQPIIEGSLGSVAKGTGTSAAQLVCWDEDISDGERFVVRQDAAVYEGEANVTSFQDVEVDRITFGVSDSMYGPSFVLTQSSVHGMAFSSDGTNLYCVEAGADNVHQYSLSTAWDINTASYDSVSFDVSAQDTSPHGVDFNQDGTKMYMTGYSSDAVHQYSLSTAWDINTASYDSVSFDVSAQDSVPIGVNFNPDGTMMYIMGFNSMAIFQYELSTAWDISSADLDNSYFGSSLSTSAQGTAPDGITFNSDGTKMYMVGRDSTYNVHEYTLSTGFDLGSASYDGAISLSSSSSYDIHFNSDEKRLYILDSTNNIIQYIIPEDIVFYKQENTINLTDFGLSESPQYVFTQVPDMRVCLEDTGPRCISRDTPMYLYGVGTDQLQVTYSDTLDQVLEAGDLVVVNEGDVGVTSVVDTGTTTNAPTYDNVSFYVGSQETSSSEVTFNNDGTRMYIVGSSSDTVYQYTLLTAFDVGTASYNNVSFYVGSQDRSPYSVTFNNDGTRMYILGASSDTVYQYTLSTAFDVGTARYEQVSINVGSQETIPYSMTFNNDGTRMYILGHSSNTVYQYTLSTAFDVGTASYDSVSSSVGSQETIPYSMTFNNDGTRMYILGSNSDTVYQYTLSTAFDFGTASYDSVSFSVGSQETNPNSMTFNNDGTRMYILGTGSNTVYQYTLTAPYSLGGDKIWNVNLPLTTIPTFVYIKDRSELMPYTRTPIAGTVYQYSISLSTAGSLNHTFDSQAFETTPRRAIQLSAIAGTDTTVTTLRANLWKAGTPTL